jgi:tetratricopeptide (TPR) repeat protein
VAFWKQRVDYASSTDIYTEYALGVAAITPGLPPAQVVDLVETLLVQNPRSSYLGMALPTYFAALGKVSDAEKQLEAADRILANFPDSEDALYALAEGNLAKSRAEQAATHAKVLLSTLISKPKPEGIPDADWDTKKSVLTGRANYIAGVAGCMREMWAECDRFLRVAATQVASQPALAGPAYFYLGLANYRLGKTSNSRALIEEGVKFTNQSAGVVSPMQDQARQNAAAMEKDLATAKKGK